MHVASGVVTLSPTDLSIFIGCRHRTGLDLSVALGLLEAPQWTDPFAELLRQRGDDHERRFIETLRADGLDVLDLRNAGDAGARTAEAMRAGVPIIVQARLEDAGWGGYADILRRVERASNLGAWSYEAWDTKLARETKAGSILQLSAYSDMVARLQGIVPEHFHVVTPDPLRPVQTYRVDEYAAYYRLTRRQLEAAVNAGPAALLARHYPEPVAHCEVCRWQPRCEGRRRADDHLSLVADAARLHRRELEAAGITTVAAAGAMPLPLPFTPKRGSVVAFERLREQARLQVAQRRSGRPVFELLPVVPREGLSRLPEASPHDLFLDIEGDPFARDQGREYLFGLGWLERDRFCYRSWWAANDDEERGAFEALIDAVAGALDADRSAHVYHFGHYEASALKRLMGRYATREAELDRCLRGERFVDLHAVVRRALRAGVESYSIKRLEAFYGFAREMPLAGARVHQRLAEAALESGLAIPADTRAAMEIYNRDDCRSVHELRGWLETLRARLLADGLEIPRPQPPNDEAPEDVTDLDRRIAAVRERLLDGIPSAVADRDAAQQARFLLAWMLDWHRREVKAEWWEYYRLRDLPEEELLRERKALAGLSLVATVESVGRGSTIYRYTYPEQEVEIRPRAKLRLQDGNTLGSVAALDRDARTVDVRQGPSCKGVHPTAVFDHSPISPKAMQESLLRFADAVVQYGIDDAAACGVDLLLRRTPRLRQGRFEPRAEETASEFAVRVAVDLDRTVMPIQGPPGSGKTFTGARMICALLAAGRRVGVTAVSHQVIANLINAVTKEAARTGCMVRALQRGDEDDEAADGVKQEKDTKKVLQCLAAGEVNLVGGTAWLWASEHAVGAVDVLFVDEAGQMSLANVLAVSPAADSLVLLGDPQQLEQPQKASHPDGTDVSALEHVLGGAKTMPPERGIFLPETWRMAPAICRFTSEMFYEGRLRATPRCEAHRLAGTNGFDGAGLWFVPVEHDGNQNWSGEEIDRIVSLVEQLGSSEVLVVAPYNAQVTRLAERLRQTGARVGTVDKFQGQEADAAIYSMATSRPEDAPRGMEFLYSLNRLNVATSRARCAAILVASPRLFEPECRTPRQIQLASALCRFRELAKEPEHQT